MDKDAIWYLIAGTERGRRTFRVDRIGAVEPTEETFDRPADFDLSTAWEEVVTAMERRRSTVSATVYADPALVPILTDRLGRHCTAAGTAPDGRVRLRVTAHLARAVAEQLAGFGAGAEVVEPRSVRIELASLGMELTALYGDPNADPE